VTECLTNNAAEDSNETFPVATDSANLSSSLKEQFNIQPLIERKIPEAAIEVLLLPSING
jgi:hypothetical protein